MNAIEVTLSPEDVAYSEELALMRRHSAEERGIPNLRVAEVSDLAIDRDGALAEVVIARHYDLPMPHYVLHDARLGDVGGVEVKSTRVPHGRLLLGARKRDEPEHRPIVLVVLGDGVHRIVGWKWTSQVRQERWWNTSMRRPCFAMPQSQLFDPATLPIDQQESML